MAQPFQDTIRFLAFRPTRACTGANDAAVYAGLNMVPKGRPDAPYFENCKSKRDTGYTAAATALTGTVAVASDSNIVTGTGTTFTTELQAGDFVIISRRIVLVRRVISATSFEGSVTWSANAAGLAVTLPRMLQSLNGRRATFTRGNLVQVGKGHIVGVGAGAVQVDGAALPGGGFTLDKRLRLAFYDAGTGNYTQYATGFAIPVAADFTVAEVLGSGTKDMPAGKYSIRFVPARENPSSWANPTEAIQFELTAAGSEVRVIFNVAMEGATKGQDAWRAYVSLPNQAGGPWFYYKTITATELGGTGSGTTIDLEWRGGEVEFNETVEFNNFGPPDASFVTIQSGVVILYGTDGAGATTPGPGIRVAKDDNIEAFDPLARGRLPEDIIGVTQGVGRDYVACADNVYIATLSGQDSRAITWRPFWSAGVAHSRQLVFVNDMLYGCTKAGPRRSFDDGGEGSERFEFAEDVASIFAGWNLEHVIVAHDPLNEAICYLHPSPTIGSNNFYYTEMLQFSLRTQRWSTVIRLVDSAADILVSGADSIRRALDFVANGKLYEHDLGTEAVDWYLASSFIERPGAVQAVVGLKPVALATSGNLGVFGYGVDQDVPDLSAANSASLTAAVALDNATSCRQYQEEKVLAQELNGYAVKIAGQYAGTGALNRVETIQVNGNAARAAF